MDSDSDVGAVTTYVALLGAVNVGGRKVPMAQLREVMAELGYEDVRTYLASGNVVFTATAVSSGNWDEDAVGRWIGEALEERFGFEVLCLVRDSDYLRSVVSACPFPADELEGRQLHVTFYSQPGLAERFAEIDQAAFAPEAFGVWDQVLYLYAPEGVGRSPLAAALAKVGRRRKDVFGTSRNWNTVKALVEMMPDEVGGPGVEPSGES